MSDSAGPASNADPPGSLLRDRGLGSRFVGREEERAALLRLWEETESRGSSLAVIQAPPGFGKTCLLRDFLARIGPTVVLQASCAVDEQSSAYGVLAQLVRGVVATDSVLARLGSNDVGVLDPLQVGAAVLEFLEVVGSNRLVLCVDDLQWADPPSVRALVFALRRLRTDPILTVLCCRAGAVDDLPLELQRLVHETGVPMPLIPLRGKDIATLAHNLDRDDLSQAALLRVAEHSGGSPLHIRALLTELTVSELNSRPDLPLPAPRTFAGLVAARLSGCPTDGTTLVEAAAVLGDGSTLPMLAQLGELTDPALAFEHAASAGLIRANSVGTAISFDHALTRSAVYHAIPASRRAELHRQAARLLAPSDRVGALKHRVAAASAVDRELADDISAQADLDAAGGAWVVAAEWFRVALGLRKPSDAAGARDARRMVECVALAAEPSAVATAEATLAAYPASPLRDYALGRLRSLNGRWDAAQELLTQAWAGIDPDTDVELAAPISRELARAAVMRADSAQGINWASRALDLAADDPSIREDTTALLAVAMGISGRAAEALVFLQGLPDVIADPSRAELDQLAGRGMLSLWNGDLAQARSDLASVVACTRRDGPVHAHLFAAQYLADTAYRMGDWDVAIVTAEDAAATARDLGNVWTLPVLHAVASFPHSARGNFEQAEVHVAAAAQAAALVRDIPNRTWAMVAAAKLARARGDSRSVIEALTPMTEMSQLDGVREPGVQPWQPMFAAALIDVGETDRAATILQEADFYATSRHHLVAQLAVHREMARLHTAQGDLVEALRIMRSATETYLSIEGRPFERAQFDLMHGVLLRRAGRRDASVSALRRAESALTVLRATPLLTQTAADLVACGQRPAGRNRRTPSELTPHESAVVRLVAEGLTNRQVASRLVVSVKTIDYHLGNVYTKLGVRSRVQLLNRLADDAKNQPAS